MASQPFAPRATRRNERAPPGALSYSRRMKGPRRGGVLVRVLLGALLSLAALSLAGLERTAQAEPTSTGFALDRYRPAEAGSDWFANESLDLRGRTRPAISLVAD